VAPTRLLLALLAGALLLPASAAAAAPQIEATWVTDVTATSANLRTEINPEGSATTYRFEYLTLAAYEANVKAAKDPFAGALLAPPGGVGSVGSGSAPVERTQHVAKLSSSTLYRFRVVASSEAGTAEGPERSLGTEDPTNAFVLLDDRGWEMVSPADKGGGAVQPPESIFGGGAFQAASGGQSLAYSSADSFGDSQGAPPGSQYVATRSAAGWATANITAPLSAGAFGQSPDGVPYRLFSADLSMGLLSNGRRCRTEVGECPVAGPPLAGSGAPAGYRNYYLRTASGYQALIDAGDLTHTSLEAKQFEITLAGATEDLSHIVLTSCAALTSDATEVPATGGCEGQNLYEWEAGALRAINLLPGGTQTAPGATLAAPIGAISTDGTRVYFTQGGNLYLRDGTQSKQVDEAQAGGGAFQAASSEGRYAFFTKASHLYRWDATSGVASDLTPSAGVQGVLGISASGSVAYYLTAEGLFQWREGVTTKVAAAADVTNYPPATGASRVSADGAHLLFLSSAALAGSESNGLVEAYLWGPPPGGGGPSLICVSCNPTGERPTGAASVPGTVKNGSTRLYKPRTLSAGGNRVFFESEDALVIPDSNHRRDVYEWEARGEGSCQREGGCVQLVSSGRSPSPSTFLDASANGSDAFFLTDSSIVPGDPGSFDAYDAREGGGFPAPPAFIACEGDACQPLPEAPEDPTPGTLVSSVGNPPPHFATVGEKGKHHKGKGKKHHKKHPDKGKKGGKK
jgi:hypothetical protein